MKKLVTSLFVLMFTLLCIPACAFAATDFYAMSLDKVTGNFVGEKIYEISMREDETQYLVFYSGDELLDSSDLTIDGLYRDFAEEETSIQRFCKNESSWNGEYPYEDNIVCINGFENYAELHQVSYEDVFVKFNLMALNYRMLRENKNGEWIESNERYIFVNRYDESSYDVRFYYDQEPLIVESVSFVDENDQQISDSIVSTSRSGDINYWNISYTDNVNGEMTVKTNLGKEYTMPVEFEHFKICFCDDEEDEIKKFVYNQGKSEDFYLFYNYFDEIGEITELENADKVDIVEKNGEVKFFVKECQDYFTYSIKVKDNEYKIKIVTQEYDFHAKEVKIDELTNTYIEDTKLIKKIRITSKSDIKYFVFYNEGQMINLSDEALEEINDSDSFAIEVSENAIIKNSSLNGFVYEIKLSKNTEMDDCEIIYDNSQIDITAADFEVGFYMIKTKNNSEIFTGIKEFEYDAKQDNAFYLYTEETEGLERKDIDIIQGQGNVTLSEETLTVDSEELDVIKIILTNYTTEFDLKLHIEKWDVSLTITITESTDTGNNNTGKPNTDNNPLVGFYSDYINMTEATFLGDEDEPENFDYTYVSGDVFYYVREDGEGYISSGDLNIRTELPLKISYINTGLIELDNGVYDDKYAIKFTVPIGTRGNYEENLRISYIDENGDKTKTKINITLDDAYDLAPIGREDFEYNKEEYAIGFVSGDNEILSSYTNSYEMSEEGKNSTVKIPIKIFETTTIKELGKFVENFEEMPDYYENIDDIEVYVAMYNPYEKEYEKVNTDVSNYLSINVQRESEGFKRWYIDLNCVNNALAEYYIVAEVTMDDKNDVTFAMKYTSNKIISSDLDLTSNTSWGITEINEYISKDIVNTDATLINIKLNPNVAYGTNGDSTLLTLKGNKAICIDGNGATIVGRVNVNLEKDATTAPLHKLTNIHFVSEPTIGSGDTDNICLDGLGQVRATKCSFENYYIAVNMYTRKNRDGYGVKNATDSCIFKGNRYGIYIDARGAERLLDETSYEIKNCRFVGNLEGIHIIEQEELKNVDEILRIYHSEFIDNTYDIANRNEDINYLAYGCLFAQTSGDATIGTIKARKPKTVEILVSYVYREHFLNTDSNDFIDGKDVASKVAYAPLAEDGKLDNFFYENLHKVGVNVANFAGNINVIGNYDMTQKEYIQYATWKFGN